MSTIQDVSEKVSGTGSSNSVVLPNFFLAGCQKTASTWLYWCFREHPEIYVPDTDATHYFTMNYFRGLEWYSRFYVNHTNEKLVGDTTPSYIRDYSVPSRLAEFNPNAKLIFTLRNPIERAFSHYWHEKKKKKISFAFSEALENYDLYENYIVAGFYYQHLTRFYQYFDRNQILVLIYEDFKKDPYSILKRIFKFLEVDNNFIPTVIEQKINVAWHQPGEGYPTNTQSIASKLVPTFMPQGLSKKINRTAMGCKKRIADYLSPCSEYYDIGIPPLIRANLREIYKPENKKLAQMIGRDLEHWT